LRPFTGAEGRESSWCKPQRAQDVLECDQIVQVQLM
ncbi:MAG: hypothetical protein RLZ51_474, partial [Pseudomonadota bacterium]